MGKGGDAAARAGNGVGSGQQAPVRPVSICFWTPVNRDKANIKVLDAADIGAKANMTGLAGSFTNVVKTFSPKVQRVGEMIEGTPDHMARELVLGSEDQEPDIEIALESGRPSSVFSGRADL